MKTGILIIEKTNPDKHLKFNVTANRILPLQVRQIMLSQAKGRLERKTSRKKKAGIQKPENLPEMNQMETVASKS